jgi:hypothetical protein
MINTDTLPPFTGPQAARATRIRIQAVTAFNTLLLEGREAAQSRKEPDRSLILQFEDDYERVLVENLKQRLDASWWIDHPVPVLTGKMVPPPVPYHYIDWGGYNAECAGQWVYEEAKVIVDALHSLQSEERVKQKSPEVYKHRRADYEGPLGQHSRHIINLYQQGVPIRIIFAHKIAYLVDLMDQQGLFDPSIRFLYTYLPEVEKEGLYPISE